VAMILVQAGPRAETPAGEANRPVLRTPHLLDPIFDIDYDPVLVRFEPEPEQLSRCAPNDDPRGLRFVFAHIIRDGIEYNGYPLHPSSEVRGLPRVDPMI